MPEQLDTNAIKIIEIVGVSTTGFQDAVDQAVVKAAESIKGINKVEVVHQSATVRDGLVARYEVRVKLSFAVE